VLIKQHLFIQNNRIFGGGKMTEPGDMFFFLKWMEKWKKQLKKNEK
jgi:hypothetical protein